MPVWQVLHHYVDAAVDGQDLSRLERLGFNETRSRRGQNYASVFADLDQRRAVLAGGALAIRGMVPAFVVTGALQLPMRQRDLVDTQEWYIAMIHLVAGKLDRGPVMA